MANTIEKLMEKKGMPSLKAIAGVFDLNAVRIYSVAKQPKEGEVYDAKVFNWDAIERFIARRLDPDKGPATLEDVIDRALEIDVELKAQDGRHARSVGGDKNKIEVDGKMVPVRKFDNFNGVGTLVCLKKDANVYKIVYQTASHTVLVPVSDKEGTVASQDVKVISNIMLNFKGIGPSQVEEGIKSRFDGTYKVPEDPDEKKPAAADGEASEG